MNDVRKRGAYIIAGAFVLLVLFGIFSADPTEKAVEAPEEELVVVQYVIDGDTVDLARGERVRLIGIDAPERGDPGYEEARARLAALVSGKEVRLVTDTTDRDQYWRLLRYIYVEDVFVNELLVQEGLAEQFPFGNDRLFEESFERAEEEAKAAGLGIWK